MYKRDAVRSGTEFKEQLKTRDAFELDNTV